ncbi:MAG: hypothetical protein R3257_05000 [bacterium]|nr:hypothetical protein [bacterium]
MSRTLSLVVLTIGILLFQVANLAYWTRFNLLNPSRFVTLSERAFQDPQVRQVLSQEILLRVFRERPRLKNRTQEVMEAAVGGILESPLMTGALTLTSTVLFKALSAPISEGVIFNIQPVKEDIASVLEAFDKGENLAERLEKIPDDIVLIQPGKVPPLYKIRPALFWILLLGGIGALGLIALGILKGKSRTFSLKVLGGLFISSSLLVYYLTYPARDLVLSYLSTPVVEVFAYTFFNEFTFPLKIQLWVLIFIGLGIWFGLFFQKLGAKQ